MKETKQTHLSSRVTFIIAVILIIASSLFYIWGQADTIGSETKPVKTTSKLDNVLPVSATDHVRGDPYAPIIIVEYSDTECPFCNKLQATMKEVISKYEPGEVAWVYRHFPIDELHPKARKEAVALECAGELGGNDIFWSYTDRLYETTPANNNLDPEELPKIAEYVGLNREKFNECLASTRYDALIESHVQNAQATGAQGTPWSIVIGKNGKKYSFSGAQPASAIQQIITIASK